MEKIKRAKRVIRCFGCNRVVRKAGSFSVRLEQPELYNGRLVNNIKLCRTCTKEAGYKVKDLNAKK